MSIRIRSTLRIAVHGSYAIGAMKRRRDLDSEDAWSSTSFQRPAVSADDIVACLHQEGEVVDRVSALKSLLDKCFDRSFEATSSMSEFKSGSEFRVHFYESVLCSDDLLSRLSVDVFWILSCAGMLSFGKYVESVDVTRLVTFLREDVMSFRFNRNGAEDRQHESMLSSIFIDIIVFLFSHAHLTAVTKAQQLQSKCLIILDRAMFPSSEMSSLFDLFILHQHLTLFSLFDDTSAVETVRLDVLRRLLLQKTEYQSGSHSASELHHDVLSHYRPEDIHAAMTSVIRAESPIMLDSLFTEASSSSSRHMLVVALEYLAQSDVSQSTLIAQRLGALCADCLADGLDIAVRRIISLVDTFAASKEMRGVGVMFLGALSHINITTQSFTIFCRLMVDLSPWLALNNLITIADYIKANKDKNLDSAEHALLALQLRSEELGCLPDLISGDIITPQAFQDKVAKMRVWVEAYRRSGEMPGAIQQMSAKDRQRYLKAWLGALSSIAERDPALEVSCLQMAQMLGMDSSTVSFPLRATDLRHSAEKRRLDSQMSKLVETLGIMEPSAVDPIRAVILTTSHVLELVHKGEYFSSADLGDQALKRFSSSCIAALQAFQDSHVLSSLICAQLSLMTDAVAKLHHGKGESMESVKLWLRWLSSAYKRIVLGNRLLEAALVAMLSESLESEDHLVPWRLGLALHCNDDEVRLHCIVL